MLLVEYYVPGNISTTCSEVHTPIALVLLWIPEEKAGRRPWGEFVGGEVGEIWVTQAAKDSKVVVGWVDTVEEQVRGDIFDG